MAMGKLEFLSPKHAVARVEAGGRRYEEMLDLVVDFVRKLCHKHADNLVPAMTKDKESQRQYIDAVLRLDAKNYRNALDFVTSHAYMFLHRPTDEVLPGVQDSISPVIHATWDEKEQRFRDRLIEYLEPLALDPVKWTHESIAKAVADVDVSLRTDSLTSVTGEEVVSEKSTASQLIPKPIWRNIRESVCFGQSGPSTIDVMLLLGGEIVLDRIKKVKVVTRKKRPTPKKAKESNIHVSTKRTERAGNSLQI